jgi:hypothetical protein
MQVSIIRIGTLHKLVAFIEPTSQNGLKDSRFDG